MRNNVSSVVNKSGLGYSGFVGDTITKEMKQKAPIKARDEGIVTLRVFVTPEERDAIQQKCKENGFTMAHALRVLGLEWTEKS